MLRQVKIHPRLAFRQKLSRGMLLVLLVCGLGSQSNGEGRPTPQIAGEWRLTKAETHEGAQPPEKGAEVWIRQEGNNCWFHFSKADLNSEKAMPIKLVAVDDSYGFDLRLGDKTMLFLAEINPERITLCVSMDDPTTRPKKIAASIEGKHWTFTIEKVRDARILLKSPKPANITVGDWTTLIVFFPYTLSVPNIPPDFATPFDVTIEVESSGKLIKDRVRVWIKGGQQSVADFADVLEPAVGPRTLRYWTCCLTHLREGMSEAESARPGEKRDGILRTMAFRIKSAPARGVDPDAIDKWVAVADACEKAVAARNDAFGLGYLLESLSRGLQGDIGGAAAERLNAINGEARAFLSAIDEVTSFAPKLTNRYDTEFPLQ